MAAIFYSVVLFSAGTLFTLALARTPIHRWWRATVWLFTVVVGGGALLNFQQLHILAVLVLSVGVATQAAALAARHPDRFVRLVRRSAPLLAALLASAAAGPAGWRLARERHAVASLPPAPGRPNVLVIILDTVRSLNLSAYGYHRSTSPTLERLAARGALFVNAVSPSSWTLPSHASAFTGLWPNEIAADWEVPLERGPRTLAEVLSDQGWRTAGFVANTHYLARESGIARGFAHYEDFVSSPGQIVMSSSIGRGLAYNVRLRRAIGDYELPGRRTAADITQAFLDWLPSDTTRPFFAFLNFYDAHEPYLPPSPYRERWGTPAATRRPMIWPGRRLTPDEVADEINQYDGTIAYMDDQLATLFAELAARRRLDRTLVVVTADHGEEFGEHGLYTHGYSLYRPSLAIPLVFALPGVVPEGVRIEARVSLRDLAASVLALAGADQEQLPGNPLLTPHSAPRSDTVYAEVRHARGLPPSIPVSRGDIRGVLTTRHSYIRYADGGEDLFDLFQDPEERASLIGAPGGDATGAALRAELSRRPPFGSGR